jgi:membrane peptidoglycan carboxypeptidase
VAPAPAGYRDGGPGPGTRPGQGQGRGRGTRSGGPGGRGGGAGGRGGVKVKGSWWRRWTWKKALGVASAGIGLFILIMVIGVLYAYSSTSIPSQELAADTYQNSTVYFSDGKTPIGTFGDIHRQILTYNQIPKIVDDAVMAAEDRSFMTEGGISPTGIMRAAWDDITGGGGNLSGGSTITQEFVRQYYEGIGTQQTMSRKVKEIFVSMKISKEKSKQWILTNYLNTIYLGQGAYGVAAAAQTYFNEPVSKLTIAQAAVIAAIIQQPTNYPLPQYRPELENRWHYVLDGMVKIGDLTAAQAATMKFPAMNDAPNESVGSSIWDPYVMNVVQSELESVDHISQQQLDDGGLKIVTTINPSMESELYKAVDSNETLMREDGGALPWYALVGAELQNPSTGSIVAMYGGRGQNMPAKQCAKYDCDDNTAVYTREQVGSSFKPYVLSAAVKDGMNVKTSILNGYSPLWVAPDTEPTTLSSRTQQPAPYHEFTNDDNEVYGPMTVANAIAQSSNTAFTDLTHRVGTQNVVNMAEQMGVNTGAASGLQADVGEVGMALGENALTVNEQDTMLSTIDNNGLYHSAHIVQSVTYPDGSVKPGVITQRQVLTPQQASQVQYAMSFDVINGTGTAAEMSPARPIIAKTGTTDNAQSAFFIGAIPQYALTVGIFTQNQSSNTTQSLNGLGGNTGGGFGGYWPARIWNTFAQDEFAQLPVEQFQAPVFTGQEWNQVGALPTNKKKSPNKQPSSSPSQPGQGHHHFPQPSASASQSPPVSFSPSPTPTSASPTPSYTGQPALPGGGGGNGGRGPNNGDPNNGGAAQATSSTRAAGFAFGGAASVLPGSLLWVRISRRRRRRRRPRTAG